MICARADCGKLVGRKPRGRPAIYCSPACWPSRHRQSQGPVIVEVDHPDTSPDGRPAERVWVVTLRRGQRSVVLANDLGWPSAHALAGQLEDLLHRPVPHEGGAIG